MGIMMTRDTNNNTEIDRRISADLRARAQQTHRDLEDNESSAYTKDTQKTNKFTWVWIVLIVLAVLSLIGIFFI